MSDVWPLLDIRDAVRECDDLLTDLIADVTMLQTDSTGQYPPGAQVFLANIVTLRALLADVFPPALQHTIADEQTVYDEEEARWDVSY
jgi:hypothetical protein